ncbi:glycerate kinase [Euzebya sp.]|uniref:glycerate kinase n=1 Tax=Euzebya sp. TaxID=1971409 RepID=UPI003512A2B9
MRVLICPDKFAGTLTAVEAATAIAEGWRAVRPSDQIVQVPLADGGEGTTDVLAHARPDAAVQTVEVADARGIATDARWVSLPDGTAVIEVAQACGLSVLDDGDRDPLRTTTYGVGQLLAAVLATAPSRVVVGLGGSATVDGGAGMVAALGGHGLRRADGNAVKVGGRWVAEVVRVAPLDLDGTPPVVVASDVTNPLLGPAGAAAVFGPQKGADADAVAELEAALAGWADVVERTLPGGPWRDRPGAGAAGGLGFALMAFLSAEVRSGAAVIGDLIGLDPAHADVVVTGEGKLDAQTLGGKGPDEIRRRAAVAGARTVAVAGVIADDAGRGFDVVEDLGPEGLTRPYESAVAAASRAARRIAG